LVSCVNLHFPQNSFVWQNKKIDSRTYYLDAQIAQEKTAAHGRVNGVPDHSRKVGFPVAALVDEIRAGCRVGVAATLYYRVATTFYLPYTTG
jgi:hypothetical protein